VSELRAVYIGKLCSATPSQYNDVVTSYLKNVRNLSLRPKINEVILIATHANGKKSCDLQPVDGDTKSER
jgi:hypothetical protein